MRSSLALHALALCCVGAVHGCAIAFTRSDTVSERLCILTTADLRGALYPTPIDAPDECIEITFDGTGLTAASVHSLPCERVGLARDGSGRVERYLEDTRATLEGTSAWVADGMEFDLVVTIVTGDRTRVVRAIGEADLGASSDGGCYAPLAP